MRYFMNMKSYSNGTHIGTVIVNELDFTWYNNNDNNNNADNVAEVEWIKYYFLSFQI